MAGWDGDRYVECNQQVGKVRGDGLMPREAH
jgi:hypothetical protein